jgi:hypothetical protein
MIIDDKAADARLNSPMNLMNKLKSLSNGNGNKRHSAMSLFGIGKDKEIDKILQPSFNPFENKKTEEIIPYHNQNSTTELWKALPVPTPTNLPELTTLDNILENHDSQIKLGLAHDKALDLLTRSVDALSTKLDDVRADKLPAVISAASKTVESIRRERSEQTKNNKDKEVHYHFYTPEQKKISDYSIIEIQ